MGIDSGLESQAPQWHIITNLDTLSETERLALDEISKEARKAIGKSTVGHLSPLGLTRIGFKAQSLLHGLRHPRYEMSSDVVTFVLSDRSTRAPKGLAQVRISNGQHIVEIVYIQRPSRDILKISLLLKSLAAYARVHDPSWECASLVFDRAEYAKPLLSERQVAAYGGTSGPLRDEAFGGTNGRTGLIRTTIPAWIPAFERREKREPHH